MKIFYIILTTVVIIFSLIFKSCKNTPEQTANGSYIIEYDPQPALSPGEIQKLME